MNTQDGPYVCLGDLATRPAHILGTSEAPAYSWQSRAAGSLYRTSHAFKRIMALVDGNIDRVIMGHNSEYEKTLTPAFSEGPIIRFQFR